MLPSLQKQVLSPQNTPVHFIISISFSVWVIQYLSVLLNSLGNFVYMMNFLIKYYVRKNLKGSKLGQILRADKTGFCRLGHILHIRTYYIIMFSHAIYIIDNFVRPSAPHSAAYAYQIIFVHNI